MSQAHKGSIILDSKSMVSIDKSTTFLAHYDITENEVLSGIAPKNGVFTMLPRGGKFGGGILIEEGTANLVANPTLFSSGWTSYTNGHDGAIMSEFGTEALNIVDRISWCGASKGVALPAAGTYTLSVWVKPIARTSSSIEMALYTSGGGLGDTCVFADWSPDKIGKWQRLSMTLTYTGTSFTLYLICFGGAQTTDYKITAQYTMPQVEQKSFATSFANGSRAVGILEYPADCINPSQGTISFWYSPNYAPSDVTDQFSSPKLIQVGGYFASGSISVWNFLNTLRVYAKGSSDAGWSGTIMTGVAIPQNTWTMITITWNGTAWKVYINGVLVGSTTATQDLGAINGNSMFVGGEGGNGGAGGKVCNGIIDELRIDAIARTDEEIMKWYVSGAPFMPRGIYTVAY